MNATKEGLHFLPVNELKMMPSTPLKKNVACLLFLLFFSLFFSSVVFSQTTSLRFETTIARGLISAPQNGRLFIFLSHESRIEPRLADDDVALNAPPILAKDVKKF